jgi:hypothetical protein
MASVSLQKDDQGKGGEAELSSRSESGWRSPAAMTALLSVVLSLAALGVSIRGCEISQRAIHLAASDFQAARAVVYQGTISAEEEILFAPIDSSAKIQEGTAYFPPQVDKTEWHISPPGFGLPLVVLRDRMQEVLNDRFPREAGYVQVVDQASVPFVIESSYVAKNEPFYDKSLYQLTYIAVLSDDELKPPTITFKGISFLQRLSLETDSHKFLEELWKSAPVKVKQPNASN